MVSTGVKRPLPRLLEQIRILTWFQFHLCVMSLVVAVVAGAILSRQTDESARQGLAAVWLFMLVLGGTAALLAIAAASVGRGWLVALPLVILAELAVLLVVWLAIQAGFVSGSALGALTVLFVILLGVLVLLLAALGGWIAVQLFRPEVLTFLRRS